MGRVYILPSRRPVRLKGAYDSTKALNKTAAKATVQGNEKPSKRINTFKVKKELESLVEAIERDEARLAELQTSFCDPDFYKSTDPKEIQALEEEMKTSKRNYPR